MVFESSISSRDTDSLENESGHYVVTSHRPGGVILSCRCSFLAPDSLDVVIVKARRLEVHRFSANASDKSLRLSNSDDSLFPLVISAPIHGRITTLLPFRISTSKTDLIFFTTDTEKYAVISYLSTDLSNSSTIASHLAPYNIITHATGDLRDYGVSIRSRQAECGPLGAVDPTGTCIALHLFDGFVTILPLNPLYKMSTVLSRMAAAKSASYPSTHTSSNMSTGNIFLTPFHCRIEEITVLSMTFLIPTLKGASSYMPQLTFLHQDAKGKQHIVSHSVDLSHKGLILNHQSPSTGLSNTAASKRGSSKLLPPPPEEQLSKQMVDGGSGIIISVPPVDWNSSLFVSNNSRQSQPATVDNTFALSSAVQTSHLFGGILILGQKQIIYHSSAEGITKVLPIAQCFILSHSNVTPLRGSTDSKDPTVRYLLGNEYGQLILLAIARSDNGLVSGLHLDVLGTTSISSTLTYIDYGFAYVGSQFGDSQLIKILDEPEVVTSVSDSSIEDTDPYQTQINSTYVGIVDEYTNLGPVVDFDLIPTLHGPTGTSGVSKQSMMVCASGTGKDGSIRIVRNGIGMSEYAAVELPGIRGMWSIKFSCSDKNDAYLIQSYVGETRILGVAEDFDVDDKMDECDENNNNQNKTEARCTLAEVLIPGFTSSQSTLFAGNIELSTGETLAVQITDEEVRLISMSSLECLHIWRPNTTEVSYDTAGGMITIGTGNRFGQLVVSLRGGLLVYLGIEYNSSITIKTMGTRLLDHEISCIDINPFSANTTVPVLNGVMNRSAVVAVGLWDTVSVKLLSLSDSCLFSDLLSVELNQEPEAMQSGENAGFGTGGQFHKMARSLCLVTLDSSALTTHGDFIGDAASAYSPSTSRVNMLFVGLGDGGLLSFVIETPSPENPSWSAHTRKEVNLGTREIDLIPFTSISDGGRTCVLVTGDRPTIVYLAGGSSSVSKLCYSSIYLSSDSGVVGPHGASQNLVVSVAASFYSEKLLPHLPLSRSPTNYYSLCLCDGSTFRMGFIDNIQKLHVTTQKLGMAPRRIAYHEVGRLICVGCIDDGLWKTKTALGSDVNMGNCIRFFDDATFEEVDRLDLEPFEMVLSLISMKLKIVESGPSGEPSSLCTKSPNAPEVLIGDSKAFVIVGTAYAYPDEDEPLRGRILVLECSSTVGSSYSSDKLDGRNTSKCVKMVTELLVKGGVYSMCPFYDGSVLVTINSKTQICKLVETKSEDSLCSHHLQFVGIGHHGHILSLLVRSLALHDDKGRKHNDQLAIVGDLMRSISVIQYFPKYNTLEEIARDYNQNWTTAIEMLHEDIYIGAENFHNLFVLRRNSKSQSEELRCRLDTVGVFNLGEMPNKLMRGSLVMPFNSAGSVVSNNTANSSFSSTRSQTLKPTVGSRTIFATVDGTIGSILGVNATSFKFLCAIERSITRNTRSIGDLSHDEFRAFRGERRQQPVRGFVDGDLIESFLDLDRRTMQAIVSDMNQSIFRERDNTLNSGTDRHESMEVEKLMNSVTIDDVLTLVEEMSMLH